MNPQQIAGQPVLFLLMAAVGLELTTADFRRVLAAPRAGIGGTLGQILLLPAMSWLLVLWHRRRVVVRSGELTKTS